MKQKKSTFALFFGNRGFFPASLMDAARKELPRVLKSMGHDSIMLDVDATRHGAVETPAEGKLYAEFLRKQHGNYDGVILCLPGLFARDPQSESQLGVVRGAAVFYEMLENRRIRTLGKRRILHDSSNHTLRTVDSYVTVEPGDMDASPRAPAARLESVLSARYSMSPPVRRGFCSEHQFTASTRQGI